MLAGADGNFDKSEIEVINKYLGSHDNGEFDIDSELQLLESFSEDGATKRFGEAAESFKLQTSKEDRLGMIDFAVNLIAADGKLAQEELQLFSLLSQHWDFDVEGYVKTLLAKSA
jgi:tellurite resistance protein